MNIAKTAVLGAGLMGSQIAAHMANAGAEVLLLDRPGEDASHRNSLSEQALAKLKDKGRALTKPANAQRITCGNFEDDLHRLSECDWILEAIVEQLEIKQALYQRVQACRREGSAVTSNTSTLPLAQLKEGMPQALQKDLFITHFFNPPRQMRLLELIAHPDNDQNKCTQVRSFIVNKMGKTIVPAADEPGFIGNRIGIYWLMQGLQSALAMNIPVPLADKLFGKPLGFPKTGIFGLADLVGCRLVAELTHSMQNRLASHDAYQDLTRAREYLDEMLAAGESTFYKDGKVRDLASGRYLALERPDDPALSEKDPVAIMNCDSAGGQYAREVLCRTLNYAAAVAPTTADSIVSVDRAMELGFNWRQGPFKMIDNLSSERNTGAQWLRDQLQDKAHESAPALSSVGDEGFYTCKNGYDYYLAFDGQYQKTPMDEAGWTLHLKTQGSQPILKNSAARLWAVEDDIACFEFTNKMGTIDSALFDLLEQSLDKVGQSFRGLIIGHDDKHFSAGLNLRSVMALCEQQDWNAIDNVIKRGQRVMSAVYCSPFPVVAAPAGQALGGACELILHSDAVQTHIESYIGLVEQRIGVVPAWGGCAEMLARHLHQHRDLEHALAACKQVFTDIAQAKTSKSAELAREQLGFSKRFEVSMNRDALLGDAVKLCREIADRYAPPERNQPVKIPLKAAEVYQEVIEGMDKLDDYDRDLRFALAYILSGGQSTRATEFEVLTGPECDGDYVDIQPQQLMDLERRVFMHLIRQKETQEKIKAVL